MNFTRLVAAVVLVFTQTTWADMPPDKIEITDEARSFAKGGNQFAMELFHKLNSNRQSNLFFSPYSISSALTMAYTGSDGLTGTQMERVLHLPDQRSQSNSLSRLLREVLITTDEQKGMQVRIANRLWGQDGFHFLPDFVQILKTDYGVEMGLVDFKQSDAARKMINSWIGEQTGQKIPQLIAPGVLTNDTRLVLTNAIFFKARWKREFKKHQTSNRPFYTSEALKVDVPTMQQTQHFPYVEAEDCQVLELPYAPLGNTSMLIVLPKKLQKLADVEKQLSADVLEKWLAAMQPANIDVQLPKFKMSTEFNLADVLKSLGMSLAFSDKAEFSKMTTQEQLFISAVIHKAFVDVDEEGTEATAATAITFGPTSIRQEPKEPIKFHADHPFLFLIRDRSTGTVLFVGRVADPKN